MSATDARPRSRTRIGNLASPHHVEVDERGTVTVADRAPVEWWVGAEDRWHLPAVEPPTRVRQWLVDAMPVVATAVRVPGGEIVQRAFAARTGSGEVVAIEVENASAVPVALALVGDVVLSRAPNDVARAPDGRRISIVPLTHRTTVRALVPLDAVSLFPGEVPSAAQVASGWRVQTGRGMRIVLPDEQLQHDVDAARAQLLLRADVGCARDLVHQGFVAEAHELLVDAALVAEQTTGALDLDLLIGLATIWRIEREEKLADAVAPLVRRTLRRPPESAHSPADVLERVRAQLVDDGRDGCLALFPLVPDAWLGQGLEVHDAPTAAGTLSYAVRWHGARPALLWELTPREPRTLTTLTAPGLDPTWSSTDARGEALLAPVEPAGGLPKVYGARPIEPGAPAPEVGESYS